MENLCNAIAIGFGIQLLWSYYRNCYRKGYTMDIWHFTLFNMYFVIHVMLPFSRSPLNRFALGGLLDRTLPLVTTAYLISAAGYAAVLAGGTLWRVELGLGTRRWVARVLDSAARGPLLLLESRALMLTHGLLAVGLEAGILLYYFKVSGFGFYLRGLLLVSPVLRPIGNFSAFYSVLIGSLCLARYAVLREKIMLAIVVAIAVGLLFFGARSTLLGLVMLTALVAMLRMGRRLKWAWLLAGVAGGAMGAFLLNGLRSAGFSLATAMTGFAVATFYGNSFSDTRDFAVVLSFWDGHYFLGQSYLAGLMAFIPRALSSFRDHWAIGVITATMAGFSPKEHPGMRPGLFGEAFLNFGMPGVVVSGLIIGTALRFVDGRMKQALRVLPARSLKVYSYHILFAYVAAVELSSNAAAVYSVIGVFAMSWVFVRGLGFLKLETAGV